MQDAAPRAILLLHARTIANEHILHAQLFSMSILHSAWENGKPEPYGQCGLYFGIRSKSACPRRIGWYKGFEFLLLCKHLFEKKKKNFYA